MVESLLVQGFIGSIEFCTGTGGFPDHSNFHANSHIWTSGRILFTSAVNPEGCSFLGSHGRKTASGAIIEIILSFLQENPVETRLNAE